MAAPLPTFVCECHWRHTSIGSLGLMRCVLCSARQDKLAKGREKRGELERIDIQNFKGQIAHVKNNEDGEYRRTAARKKVGKKKKVFQVSRCSQVVHADMVKFLLVELHLSACAPFFLQVGKTYVSSAATARKWASKKKALESGKVHPSAQSRKSSQANRRN